MVTPITLQETRHPIKEMGDRYDSLLGIDLQKQELLSSLTLMLQPDRLSRWEKHHYPKGLSIMASALRQSPLILLSGDVGCGKTELAQTVGTPLSKALGKETVVTFDTPSDVRGHGLVGEVSARITATFATAKTQLRKHEYGLLIIDEADDLATSREQEQAHHEDRAGVNALIKEIDALEREGKPIAVILITNRPAALDPAVLRRAASHIRFERPEGATLRELWDWIAAELSFPSEAPSDLFEACSQIQPLFSFSDIFRRVLRTALLQAIQGNSGVQVTHVLEAIRATPPTPTFNHSTWKTQQD